MEHCILMMMKKSRINGKRNYCIQTRLGKDVSDITDEKDIEISHLNKKPENLKTKIESIHGEIYNLKMLAEQK